MAIEAAGRQAGGGGQRVSEQVWLLGITPKTEVTSVCCRKPLAHTTPTGTVANEHRTRTSRYTFICIVDQKHETIDRVLGVRTDVITAAVDVCCEAPKHRPSSESSSSGRNYHDGTVKRNTRHGVPGSGGHGPR